MCFQLLFGGSQLGVCFFDGRAEGVNLVIAVGFSQLKFFLRGFQAFLAAGNGVFQARGFFCRAFLRCVAIAFGLRSGDGRLGRICRSGFGTGFFRFAAFYRGLDKIGFVVALGGGAGFGLGGFQARFALGFFLCRLAFNTGLTRFKALLGTFRFDLVLFRLADFRFGRAVVLHQRDITGAGIRAGATLDAVKQIVFFELVVLLSAGEPVHLLWKQRYRAGLRAHTAADTGLSGWRWR